MFYYKLYDLIMNDNIDLRSFGQLLSLLKLRYKIKIQFVFSKLGLLTIICFIKKLGLIFKIEEYVPGGPNKSFWTNL